MEQKNKKYIGSHKGCGGRVMSLDPAVPTEFDMPGQAPNYYHSGVCCEKCHQEFKDSRDPRIESISYGVVQVDLACALSIRPQIEFATIDEAYAHLTSPSDFVVAVENGEPRPLNEAEEARYKQLI